MRFLITTAVATWLGIGAVASAQGPVREGLSRTGEIAAEGTRRVVQGTAEIARGTGEAAVGTVRRAGEATRNVAGATARGVRGGVDAITPDLPIQLRAGANLSAADQRRDARWRFNRHNGEWWYYSPQSAWMYHRDGRWNSFAKDSFQPLNRPQPYATGYRGVDQEGQARQSQQAQMVRIDRWGREYVCENGRPVYLDQSQVQSSEQQMMRPEAADSSDPDAPLRPTEADQPTPQTLEQESAASAQATPRQGAAEAPGSVEESSSPQSPREISNNPNPAPVGSPSTSGAGDPGTRE